MWHVRKPQGYCCKKKGKTTSVIGIKTWEYAKLISFSNKKSKGYFIDGTRGRRSGLSEKILFLKWRWHRPSDSYIHWVVVLVLWKVVVHKWKTSFCKCLLLRFVIYFLVVVSSISTFTRLQIRLSILMVHPKASW